MQNYSRIHSYIQEYWNLIYNVYGKHADPYVVTYYNLDTNSSVWDNEYLMGGYYEKVGELSGVKWNKYILLPVYFIEETTTIFDAQESGYINEGDSGCVIPGSYGLTCYPNDMIRIDQTITDHNPTQKLSIYCVTGVQKQSPTDGTFWKLKLSVEQSRTTEEIESQISNTYIFFEYDKKIHTIEESQTMTKMLSKAEELRYNLKNLYDENSGLYFL